MLVDEKWYEFICEKEMQIAKVRIGGPFIIGLCCSGSALVHYPLNWAMDAATFLFAWTVFLGADAAMRLDRLFCIEVITSRLSPKAQLYLQIINYSIITDFFSRHDRIWLTPFLDDPVQGLSGDSRFQLFLGYAERADRLCFDADHRDSENQNVLALAVDG